MLLEDVFIIENLQVLNEGKTGPMRVRGVFQRADEENNNKRIYPKALLEREIAKLDEAMKGRRLMGELDHPQHDSVKLSNVSHLITKLEAKGNEIIGEAEILDTPMGKVAKALIEGGVQIGISSRGMGTLSEGQDGKRYVNEDFRLITWDLVADPSTRGAFPTLAEGTDLNSQLANEILSDVLPKVAKQKVFSTLLENHLEEALRGKQSKLDVNNNNRVDADDLRRLRLRKAAVARQAVRKFDPSGTRTKKYLKDRAASAEADVKTEAKEVSANDPIATRGKLAKQGKLSTLPEQLKKKIAKHSINLMTKEKKRIRRSLPDHTVFPRVGTVLFEGRPAAKRVGELDAQGKSTGMSYVTGGRSGQTSGYGKVGGALVDREGKGILAQKELLRKRIAKLRKDRSDKN